MITLIINSAVVVVAICALIIILAQHIHKSFVSWIVLIGGFMSAISMFINQEFYDESFASFTVFIALIGIHLTSRILRRGEI